MSNSSSARFVGVGVGPGDPGLITLKAAELIRRAEVVSYIASEAGRSQARWIARELLEPARDGQEELAIVIPMCDDRALAVRAYDQGAADIQHAIDAGRQVVFLCEGDPLFFGSFAHMLSRLAHNPCEVVPGISSIHAAASALRRPLALLTESFAVVSGRHSNAQLIKALEDHDSVVIMKAGRARPRIIEALQRAGRLADAAYLEYIGRDNECIETDVTRLAAAPGPYFSLFVVTRSQREPA